MENPALSLLMFENGKATNSLVKYAGRGFSLAAGGVPGSQKLVIFSEGMPVYTSEHKRGGEVFDFPELPRGMYTFSLWSGLPDSPRPPHSDFFLVVENIFPPVTPPRGLIYHIFVDRFARAGVVTAKPGAFLRGDWHGQITQYPENPGDYVENNEFFGGNLAGVTKKLDYIKQLGCEWIYLSPVFEAYSNHKYDTGDYLSVDSMFGGDKALDRLISQSHKRGMKVLLDGVFNHVGRDSVYFDYKGVFAGAFHNNQSQYREWFDIKDDGSYDCWWGLTNLPKVKKTKSFRDFICDTVIPKYMKAGVDGWRLDVVDEYDNDFLEQITTAVKQINLSAVVIGEVWENAATKIAYGQRKSYFYGGALDSATNYPLRGAILNYFATRSAGVLAKELENQLKHYPKEKLLLMMNMLGSHDTERVLNALSGVMPSGKTGTELKNLSLSKEQKERGKRLLEAAHSLLICLPGIPAVYYGDETSLEGWRDPFNRKTFPWGREDNEMTDFFKQTNKLRATLDPIIYGGTEILQSNDGFFVFERSFDGKSVLCVCNLNPCHSYKVNGMYTPVNEAGAKGEVRPSATGIFYRDY